MDALAHRTAHLPAAAPRQPSAAEPELLERIAASYGGELTNYHQVLAHNFPMLEVQAQLLAALFAPTDDLSSTERSLIALVVSRQEDCLYAEQFIRFFLRRGTATEPGLSEPVISLLWENFENGMLDSRMREVCRFATRVARNARAVTIDDCARLRQEGLSDRSILEVIQIVAFYRFATTTMNALSIPSDLDEASQNRRLDAMREQQSA